MERVTQPDYTITMHGRASLVPGKVGNGVLLSGSGDYVSFDDQRRNCMGNLKLCKHGLTIAFLINPRQLISDSYILSSASYSVFFRDNKVIFILYISKCCLFCTFQFHCFILLYIYNFFIPVFICLLLLSFVSLKKCYWDLFTLIWATAPDKLNPYLFLQCYM